jgi:hypothetical protein
MVQKKKRINSPMQYENRKGNNVEEDRNQAVGVPQREKGPSA